MLHYKYRKQLVINRKLPRYKFIGRLDSSFISSAMSDYKTCVSTINVTKKNNHFISEYKVLNHYDQRHTSLKLSKIFDVFGEIYDLRYGILEPNKVIPPHVDAPDGHRFIALLEGNHTYVTNDKKIEMSKGELWFINSSFEHSIINSNTRRIALLGKFNNVSELL